MNVLICGGERIGKYLAEQLGIVVEWAEDPDDIYSILEYCGDFDCVVADVGIVGEGFPKYFRERHAHGLIMLTNGDAVDRAEMLINGADHAMTMPVDMRLMFAHLKAIVRRYHMRASDVITVGELELDLIRHGAKVSGEGIHLTVNEFKLIECLANHPECPVSKENIYRHIYGHRDETDIKVIDVYVTKIRKKFFRFFGEGRSPIHTHWGLGYRLSKEVGYVKSTARPDNVHVLRV